MNDLLTSGEWQDVRETAFWHEEIPFHVKYEIEKLTGIVLRRDPAITEKLVYRGSSVIGATAYALEIRFEAVLPRAPYVFRRPTEPGAFRNLFLFHLETRAQSIWMTEKDFLRDAERTFEFWTLRLSCGSQRIDWEDASREFYEQRVRESIEREEEQARRVVDPDSVAALQKAVLEALRQGKSFRTSHKEGGTILFFDGKTFARQDFGDRPSVTGYPTDAAMIDCIRNFYDWPSRKESFPHQPPDLEVWTYIHRQLRD